MRLNIFLLFTLIFSISCSIDTLIESSAEAESQSKKIKVGYFSPIYASPGSDILTVALKDPTPFEETGKIIHYQDYIFINKPQEGIHIVNNSDPKNPINEGFIQIKGNIDMAIIDDFLYADQFSALVVLDLQDLEHVSLIEDFTVKEIFNYNRYWAFDPDDSSDEYEFYQLESVDDKQGIVVGWNLKIRLELMDFRRYPFLNNTSDLVEIVEEETSQNDINGNRQSQAGSMTRFLPVDNLLYTLNEWELILFEITENHKPLRFGKTGTNNSAETLFRLNDYLFIGTTTGMLIYGIDSPKNPTFLSRIDHFRSCDPVVADEEYAYVTLRGGTNCFTERNELQIISLKDPENLEVMSRQILFNPHGLSVYEDYIIVCDGTAGIKVVDVSDKTKPEVVNTIAVDFAYDVILDYPKAIVVGGGKVYQYNISQLPELELISQN
ncbi:hypothetical protein OAP80_02430 [Flavobacteriaceae bacterium]|nr:hypothetical protein [Flavobacteriaceae bacterium]